METPKNEKKIPVKLPEVPSEVGRQSEVSYYFKRGYFKIVILTVWTMTLVLIKVYTELRYALSHRIATRILTSRKN